MAQEKGVSEGLNQDSNSWAEGEETISMMNGKEKSSTR